MPAEAIASLSVRRVPFSRFKAFPKLFRDYCDDFSGLAEFYNGDFRARDELEPALDRALSVSRDRDTLATVLLEQNERWGLDARVRDNIDALRREDTTAVVTGQQVGIFGGPLYTLLKALTTVNLARTWSDETGRTIVPIFWLGVEDHDFEEIASVRLLRRNESVDLRYGDAPAGNPGPVGRIRMGGEIDRLVDVIDDVLPPTDFKPQVMALLRETYREGETFGDAFAKLLRSLLPDTGLVLMSSDDPRLKRLAAPLFRREISNPTDLTDRVRRVSTRVAERYREQVHVSATNLFLLADDGRHPIDFEKDAFRVRGTDRVFSEADLLQMVEETPERFSPNVVLRPLVQDVLLPTAAYVGGPGEISYFAQYRGAYEWAELPMPLIYPRASVTLLESKVTKVLEKYGLDVPDFDEDVDRLFQRVVVQAMEIDLEELFKESARHVYEAVNVAGAGLRDLDPTLGKSAEATRSALVDELEKLKAKAVRHEKKNQDVVRHQLQKAYANLFPNGGLQERTLSFLYFLNKYSPALLEELRQGLSTDTTEHQIVEL